jgi:serine/threonine protein kinase
MTEVVLVEGAVMSMGLQRLGKYELREQLGHGNVGEVWKAYDLQLRREVAIKILHADLQSDPHFFTRFTQEGGTLTTLHHTNIVQIHDVALSRPTPQASSASAYIVMESIEGQTLADYINATVRKGMFPMPGEIVYLFTSLAVAIDYAHQKGIIHGNIKPTNILFDRRNTAQFPAGEPMLTDFALTQLVGDTANVLSPFYMSPEQAQGDAPNNRSDIYSLGVLLYELCTGVQPFHDESSVAVMLQHIHTLPTPPSLINAAVPSALSEVILRAMAKDPATRFPMASLLAIAIADAYSIQSTIQLSPVSLDLLHAKEEAEPKTSSQPKLPILGIIQPSINLPARLSSLSASLTQSKPLPAVPEQTMPDVPPSPEQEIDQQMFPPTPPKSPALTGKIPRTPVTAITEPQPSTVLPSQPTGPTAVVPTLAATYAPQPASVPLLPFVPPQSVPPPLNTRRRSSRFGSIPVPLYVVITILLLLLLIAGGAIGTYLLSATKQTAAAGPLGHIFFQDDPLGHDDVLRVEMQQVTSSPAGSSDVVWLQTASHASIQLGTLTIQNGNGALLYQGDGHHTNLLSILERIIITQEKKDNKASAPTGTMLYLATPDPASFPYIRNILYSTPNLQGGGSALFGMLDAIKSMNDKASSIVDSLRGTHDYALARRQAIRIMELLDGTIYAQQSHDLPSGDAPLLFTRTGLLSSPTTKGYLDLLDQQLTLLQQHAGSDSDLLTHLQHVRNAVLDLQTWLQKTHDYDVQLLKAANLSDPTIMSIALQLRQLAADSYTGRTIPPNEGPQPTPGSAGAYQAYVEAQYMATLNILKAS